MSDTQESPEDGRSTLLLINEGAVNRALKKWQSPSELGSQPLAALVLVTMRMETKRLPATPYYRGIILAEILDEVWEAIRPQGEEPALITREWRLYVLIRERFKHRRQLEECAEKLNIERRHIQRETKSACERLAVQLSSREEAAINARQAQASAVTAVPAIISPQTPTVDTTFRRIKQHIFARIALNGWFYSRSDHEVEAVGQPLSSVRHHSMLFTNIYKVWDFELVYFHRDDSGEVRCTRRTLVDSTRRLFVDFEPPLRPGQRASYGFRQATQSDSQRTYEELEAKYLAMKTSNLYESNIMRMSAPSEHYVHEIEFPPGYPITLPPNGGFDVLQGGTSNPQERTRLIMEQAFRPSYDPVTKIWKLRLEVKNAKMGYSYGLYWVPPPAAIVEALLQQQAASSKAEAGKQEEPTQ